MAEWVPITAVLWVGSGIFLVAQVVLLVVACRALGAVPAPVTVNVMAGNAQNVVQVGKVGRRSPD